MNTTQTRRAEEMVTGHQRRVELKEIRSESLANSQIETYFRVGILRGLSITSGVKI